MNYQGPTSSTNDRHLRRKCEHCNQMLSYTAHRSHKIRYYNQSTKTWIKEKDTDDPYQYDTEGSGAVLPISMDTTEPVAEGLGDYICGHDQLVRDVDEDSEDQLGYTYIIYYLLLANEVDIFVQPVMHL